ncbi:hypothetical protein FT663_01928 [Candidozyma haemuli var. vulneris]|uniref:Thioredoxin domain-containing protein n=1 Tax=Candidozyma haemuli TaxID=45357 RepID=A0A2V1AV79_9ASCO|nr:hypothetical protein CXQ85_000413 [[Candida] haemuloni]KAF3989780.1 hypothetical protein FT662_02655 [[Candida] haemuloni var. vulneris]KAF3993338.1 hypothetical protein FT663_01928 [[Candida] haemuloni var. vulneris]PVH21436.1 hypothetical protein CXQ85_000413 [[Candida] haemuloni]
MTVVYFVTRQEYHEIISKSKETLSFVAHSATWCPPCRAVAPYYEKYSENYPKARFYKIQETDEVDEEIDAVNKEANIYSFPTFIAFRGGHERSRLPTGNPHYLEEFIKRNYQQFA